MKMTHSTARRAPSKAKELESALKKRAQHKEKRSHLVPVHISVEEVIGFNSLQRTQENPTGQFVDPKTGLREYSRLSNVLKVPEIRKLFIDISQLFFSNAPVPKEIEDIEKLPMPGEEEGLIPIPSDSDSEVKAFESNGEHHDKKMVMMPEDIVDFLDILQSGKDNNPTDGLQQFGMFSRPFKAISNPFKSVVRVMSTVLGGVGGFMVGGPAGAAAGAYAGNAIGRGLTGQKVFSGSNPAWKAAAPNALYGGAAGLGASAIGLGAAATSAAPITTVAGASAPSAGIGGIGTGIGAAPAIPASTFLGSAKSSLLGSTGSGLTGGAGSLLSMAKPYLLPAGLLAGSFLMNKKDDKDNKKEWEHEKEEHHHKMTNMNPMGNQELEAQLYQQPPMSEAVKHGLLYGKYRQDDNSLTPDRMKRYKKGGVVTQDSLKGIPLKGPGKGQDDLIHQSIPEYTWIHDASMVSGLGDGATDAGHKEIHKFEEKIRREMLPLYKDKIKKSLNGKKVRKVPCAVANGEHPTPLLLVGALGKGSFDKGADILREMTKEFRLHKSSNKHKLPPAAHDLETYYKKAIQKRGI